MLFLKMLVLNLICPFVLILVAAMMKKHPHGDRSTGNGYCTPAAQKSQARWDYAQHIAPEVYLFLGKSLLVAELLLTAALWLFRVPEDTGVAIGAGIGLCVTFGSFFLVDGKIEKEFADKAS